jgi:branched-chain amino acid transport system permease protein
VLTGVAGLLLANLTAFASPSYMSWPVSGELIVMVVIGGLGNVLGPIFGAVAYLLMEEAFKSMTQHWMLLMGPAVVVIAMVAKGGYANSLAWLRRPPPAAPTVQPPAAGEQQDRRPPDAIAKEASA